MGKEEFIAIPHFINPQLFWYHKVDGQNPAFLEVQRIEESLQSLFTAKQSAALRPHRPIVGEIVAIAFVSWNKYIRARVEYIAKFIKSDDEYIVWALDYGFPFQTKRCYVRKLQDFYTQVTDHIRLGAIANVMPAELDFDFVTTSSRLVCKQEWSQRAVEMLEKVINDAASISFIESFSADGISQKQHFGDLKIINHSGDEFFASDYLIKLNHALRSDDFRDKLATLQTIKIPCWQTNSKDIKMIENKLNALNLHYAHQGKFELSGSTAESVCDTFSKQKVIDWCERNQNFNNSDPDGEALGPSSALDATDISFDDSVSENNCKAQRNTLEGDTVMGYAGALHESRRKKYKGKLLPPKPAMEVFEVIPEKKKSLQDDMSKSGESAYSGPSQRAKALIELRKKLQKTAKEKKNDNILQGEMDKLNISSQSEAGTEEFLETCKKKNAQSARLEKLKELRKRRGKSDANSNNGSSSPNELTDDNASVSTLSSRQLLLKKIKEKHSKQITNDLENNDAGTSVTVSEMNTDIQSQTESKISSHAAKLISMRKKIKDKYSEQFQTGNSSLDKDIYVESVPAVQMHKQGYKMPQHSSKFNKLEFSKNFQNYVEPPSAESEEMCPPLAKDLKSEDDSNRPTSTAREHELQNLRRMVNIPELSCEWY